MLAPNSALRAPQAVVKKSHAPRLCCTSDDIAGVSENRASCAHFADVGFAGGSVEIARSAAYFVDDGCAGGVGKVRGLRLLVGEGIKNESALLPRSAPPS